MSSSNCCFLTCIKVSQEVGQVFWYSHFFQNFPQFIVIHRVKGFGIVNKAEIDVFLELFCFFWWSSRYWQFDLWFLCLSICYIRNYYMHFLLSTQQPTGLVIIFPNFLLQDRANSQSWMEPVLESRSFSLQSKLFLIDSPYWLLEKSSPAGKAGASWVRSCGWMGRGQASGTSMGGGVRSPFI